MSVMIDQKSRMSRFEASHDIGEMMTKLAIIGLLFVLCVSGFAVYKTLSEPAKLQDYKVGLMVSPDYESYMHQQGNGFVFNEMDVE